VKHDSHGANRDMEKENMISHVSGGAGDVRRSRCMFQDDDDDDDEAHSRRFCVYVCIYVNMISIHK
jgi:hypothetical protein